ncbi:MSCRAMM family protein [Eggerthella sinensis]|uniref:MSCRAMM family protein n=1 Tax=Eggerthella sinensis TaxID=242230 RepID=UPI00248DB6FA|nr:SpaA isopeptide-forming pilin-related protein [Eggerthella sinensis]
MAPQPVGSTCSASSRLHRVRAFFVLMGIVALCVLAFRAPAFAEDAAADAVDDAPTPRAAMDVTDKVSVDGIKLQKKTGNTWQDIPAGTTLTSGAYVRIYIDWSIPDMTDVNAGDTFTFTIDGEDHFLASNFGPVDLVDPATSKVIGSYVVNGNRDANGSMIPGQDITIVTTISAEGAEFPSLHSGFFSLEGYVNGVGDDIVFTVNGTALPSINVDPPTTGPLPGTPLLKYGSQVAGQNQIVWTMGVNLDNIVNAYANYAAGGSDPSPQQRNLLLTDELQGGQAITSGDVVVYMPIAATTDAGEAQTEQYAAYPITDLFALVDKGSSDGITQEQFASEVRFASTPTIGVWENRVVYIGYGNVPTGDGSSALNIGNILGGQGEAGLSQLLDSKGVTPTQKAIIMKYFSASGPNKGDFTSFIVELRSDASTTGQYDNTATLTYGDSSSETSTGGAYFTVISGGVEVRDGKAVLTKVDAGDSNITLPGAVFKLEKMQPDNSWATVAGAENLTSDGNGLITVTGLLLGQYRFVELVPPTGYIMEGQPVEFAITSATPNHTVAVTAKNTKSPVLGSVTLTKVDADDATVKLPGAVFKLEEQASDGTWTDVPGYETLTTDGSGLIEVRDLTMGTYRFVEVSAPEGYELETQPVEFALAEDTPGLAVAVTALNAKSPVLGKAVLTKVDADDATVKLPGAVFKLEEQASDGTWTDVPGYETLTTDGSGLIEVRDLTMGTYRFVEVSAPEGYELETQPVEFALAEDTPGLAVAVTALNAKSPVLGKAVLTKVDADDATVKLPGAVFKLEQRLADDSWATVPGNEALATDGQGAVEVADLPVGDYRFVETAAPEGYVLDETPREFSIDAAAPPPVVVGVTATNEKVPPVGSVALTKVDADDASVLLPGAVFKLEARQADGSWAAVEGSERLTTDGDGKIEVADLPLGTYRFVELEAPEGYELETEPVEFALTADTPGLAVAVTALNAKSPVLGKAVLTKVDADDATVKLPGAVFKLEQRLADDSWATVPGNEALATDGQGAVEVADLPVGDYRFVETAAPEGYVLDETPVAFEVAVGQPAQVELTMKNAPLPPDPVDPVDPTDPTDPTNPTDPSNPSTPSSTYKPSSSSPASIARTGDAFPLAAVLGALGVVAAGALVTAVVVARRRARRD